jgi:hypothetical protein
MELLEGYIAFIGLILATLFAAGSVLGALQL